MPSRSNDSKKGKSYAFSCYRERKNVLLEYLVKSAKTKPCF